MSPLETRVSGWMNCKYMDVGKSNIFAEPMGGGFFFSVIYETLASFSDRIGGATKDRYARSLLIINNLALGSGVDLTIVSKRRNR